MKVLRIVQGLDMYRKVPKELLEGTKRGSILSFISIIIMATLFLMETISFVYKGRKLHTDVFLDTNTQSKIRINFNITMMDIRCDYLVIDVVSPLGTQQNVTQHVTKYNLDARGVRNQYFGRNKLQDDIVLSDQLVKDTLNELHENGEDAVSLDDMTLEISKKEQTFLFVDFYASWCSHCKNLAPTWEVLAEVMNEAAMTKLDEIYEHVDKKYDYTDEEYEGALKMELPVMIAKIDCVLHKELCTNQMIFGYPTLRLFFRGNYHSDYHGDRTVTEMTHWLATQEERLNPFLNDTEHKITFADSIARDILSVNETRKDLQDAPEFVSDDYTTEHTSMKEYKEWSLNMAKFRRRQRNIWRDIDHPGCQISGFLWADRVPGNFFVQAQSPSHDVAAHMTNVSHQIHHLSFGLPDTDVVFKNEKNLADEEIMISSCPMDGNVYVNHNDYEAFHHFIKVVTTQFTDPFRSNRLNNDKKLHDDPTDQNYAAYQVLSSSHLSFYGNDIVPAAKFSYDLSPIAVYYHVSYEKRWYDYITSIMAIIGGVFTVFGIMDHSLHSLIMNNRI